MIAWKNNFSVPAVVRKSVGWLALALMCLLGVAGCECPGSRSLPPKAVCRVTGVGEAQIKLNGTWQFQLHPAEHFWEATNSTQAWLPIVVPGEPQMQGFDVQLEHEFAYQKRILIPADFAGKRVFVHFEGVYGEARVWINGRFLRNHLGSFTSWESELTDWVKPGEEAILTVGVTDRANDISDGTGYAKHSIGGILRDVSLLARPQTYLQNLQVETVMAADYRAATLRLTAVMNFKGGHEATLQFSLRDMQGRKVNLSPCSLTIPAAHPVGTLDIPVTSPQLWDAEHPRLYTLTTRCMVDGREVATHLEAVGFREVKVVGAKLLVNGQITKLRGACRHDMHPMLGRVATPDYESKDVQLIKEANINFIRTSHYPPTENLLRLCDAKGIYVECESAVVWSGNWGPDAAILKTGADDPALAPWYVGQAREMVESFRNHPSVIIWSMGNESQFGTNFAKSHNIVRELDRTRPVLFSGGDLRGLGSKERFNIYSVHYPTVDGAVGGIMTNWVTDGRPSIGDEWAHVPCYIVDTLKMDPGVQDFWGESLSRMWSSCYNSEDGLGGAIWGYVDEIFELPARCTGYGPWGIVDTWRREKPEFWNTKKAYSPVHLLATKLDINSIEATLPIQNRYNHTDLSELTIRWNYEGRSGLFTPTALAPRAKGKLALPALPWRDGTFLHLDFIEPDGQIADTYRIAVGSQVTNPSVAVEVLAQLEQTASEAIVKGADFSVTFDKSTGLIREAQRLGQRILAAGPQLNLITTTNATAVNYSPIEPFVLNSFAVEDHTNFVRILSQGQVGARLVDYLTTIHGNGRMTIDFKLSQTNILHCQEVGLTFVLDTGFENIAWQLASNLWTIYPTNHIGRLEGQTPLFAPQFARGYRQPPVGAWAMDSRDYFLYGTNQTGITLTRDARSCHPFIRRYAVCGTGRQVVVRGTGREGVRIHQLDSGKIDLIVNTDWDYMNLGWGDYTRGLMLPKEYSSQITLDLGR